MLKYRKKPVVIDAVLLTPQNAEEIIDAMRKDGYQVKTYSTPPMRAVTGIIFKTDQGDLICKYNEYLIKGIQGEYYPCTIEVFEKTYDRVPDGE